MQELPGHRGTRGDGLVYMVSGTDENGDQHVFVSFDQQRAKARHVTMLDQFSEVRANWLNKWG